MHVLQPSSFSLNFLSATFSHQDPRVVYKKYVSQFMMPNGHHWWAGEFTYMHYAYGHTSLFFIQVIILFYTDIYSDHCRKKSYIFFLQCSCLHVQMNHQRKHVLFKFDKCKPKFTWTNLNWCISQNYI